MFIDITDKTELVKRSPDIFKLFSASFGKDISEKEWHWFYIDNPIGDPYVSLFYDGSQPLGHYAVIPTLLKYDRESFVGYRSMTTMVHPSGRGQGLFTKLADRVYGKMESDGASLVYGFPNENSAPGFKRNLGWKILPADSVFDLAGREIKQLYTLIDQPATLVEWDSLNDRQQVWRASIPGFQVSCIGNMIIKNYNGSWNILNVDENDVAALEDKRIYRILIQSEHIGWLQDKRSVFEYQFGFRAFSEKYQGCSFKRELIMSDVF